LAGATNASGLPPNRWDNGQPKPKGAAGCRGAGFHSMEDPYELALAMLGLALTAVMLIAGALYLISTPNPEPTFPAPVPSSFF